MNDFVGFLVMAPLITMLWVLVGSLIYMVYKTIKDD